MIAVGVVALALAMGIGRFAFTPLLPLMLRDGDIGAATGAEWAALNYAGYLIGALTAARVAADLRRAQLLGLWGVVLTTLGVGALGGAWLAPGGALLRTLAGVCSAWAFVGVSSWCLGDLARRGSSHLSAWIYTGVGLGIAAAGLLTWLGGRQPARVLWLELGLLAWLGTRYVQRRLPRTAAAATSAADPTAADAAAIAADGAAAPAGTATAARSEVTAPAGAATAASAAVTAPADAASSAHTTITAPADAATAARSAVTAPAGATTAAPTAVAAPASAATARSAGPTPARAAAAPSTAKAAARGQRMLVWCYASFGFGYIVQATFLPAMAREQVSDPLVFGLTWPVFGLAAVLSVAAAARWLGSWPRRRVWALAQATMALGTALPLVTQAIWALACSALFVGGTFMVTTMAGLQLARERSPVDPTPLLARMTTAFAAGQIAGPVFVRLFGGQPWLGRAPLFWANALATALLLGSALWLARAPRTRSR